MIEYALLQAAAQAALVQSAQLSQDCHEYAGVVVKDHDTGQFYFTVPQRGDETTARIVVRYKRGDSIAAIYHTHPPCKANPRDRLFSDVDVQMADKLDVPSFIWVGYDHTVRRFDPHMSMEINYGGSDVSPGEALK